MLLVQTGLLAADLTGRALERTGYSIAKPPDLDENGLTPRLSSKMVGVGRCQRSKWGPLRAGVLSSDRGEGPLNRIGKRREVDGHRNVGERPGGEETRTFELPWQRGEHDYMNTCGNE